MARMTFWKRTKDFNTRKQRTPVSGFALTISLAAGSFPGSLGPLANVHNGRIDITKLPSEQIH